MESERGGGRGKQRRKGAVAPSRLGGPDTLSHSLAGEHSQPSPVLPSLTTRQDGGGEGGGHARKGEERIGEDRTGQDTMGGGGRGGRFPKRLISDEDVGDEGAGHRPKTKQKKRSLDRCEHTWSWTHTHTCSKSSFSIAGERQFRLKT